MSTMSFRRQLMGVMSQRNPNKETIACSADNIERLMQADGHKVWGFVIYRSTYDSDEDWKKFISRLWARLRKPFERDNGLDMINSLGFKVFEDRALFDGASTATIREHFKAWTEIAPQEEQNAPAAGSQRYQFCIQVDSEALNSVVHEAVAPPYPDPSDDGWVKIIWRDWEFQEPEPRDTTVWDAIEGNTTEEVGWSRIAYQYVMVSGYLRLRGRNDWYREYRRPPEVVMP